MRELRRVAVDACVQALLSRLSATLVAQLEMFRTSHDYTNAQRAHLPYQHGIDIRSWATGAGGPPRGYMERVEISVPLTFAAQAATYIYSMLHAPHRKSPGVETPLRAALGHSQGMATAAVAAAAGSCTAEFTRWAEAAAAHLFWLGLRIAEAVAVGAGLGAPTCFKGPWSLGVAKVCTDALEQALLKFPANLERSGSQAVRIVIRNGPQACVVAGDPSAMGALEPWLRECSKVNESLRGFCLRDWGSTAPFHHADLLAGVARKALRDTESLPKLRTKHLRLPLISCHDGTDLGRCHDELDVFQQLIWDICENPVDWPRALSSLCAKRCREGGEVGDGADACLVDFGPGGGCGALQMTRHARKHLTPIDTFYFSEVRVR